MGLPHDNAPPTVPLEQLHDSVAGFRKVAITCANWAEGLLRGLVRADLPRVKIESHGELEVSVLGARDEDLAPHFEVLSETDAPASELLAKTSLSRKLSRYFKKAHNLPQHLRDVTKEDRDTFWVSSPMAVELSNHKLVPREVLYLMRAQDDTVEALGVGYDDSARGDLAQRSFVKVARWIANRL